MQTINIDFHTTSILSYLTLRYIAISPERHTIELVADSPTKRMSSQPPGPTGAYGINPVEGLKVWSCINCRRRKVRCDRRHPCIPCSKNKIECVFPVSGRIPRRERDPSYPTRSGQRSTELLSRLRRLETMIGDLGSQVEYTAAVGPSDIPVESSTINSINPSSKETGSPDQMVAPHSPSADRRLYTSCDGAHDGLGMAKGSLDSPDVSDNLGEVVTASDGNLAIEDRFWTVFCQEVCCCSATACFALPSRFNRDICARFLTRLFSDVYNR